MSAADIYFAIKKYFVFQKWLLISGLNNRYCTDYIFQDIPEIQDISNHASTFSFSFVVAKT